MKKRKRKRAAMPYVEPVWPLTMELKHPFDGIDAITMRAPTGRDIRACGNPVVVTYRRDKPTVAFLADSMSKIIARVSGLKSSEVGRMDAADWSAAAWKLFSRIMPSG